MRVLFVCTGNSCRSPMAELYFNARMRELNRTDITAESAGISAYPDDGMSNSAKIAMAGIGLDGTMFRSRQLSRELAARCDMIVVMTPGHREAVLERFPETAGKIRLLLEYASGGSVPDPFGGSPDHYRKVFDLMRPALENLAETLVNS